MILKFHGNHNKVQGTRSVIICLILTGLLMPVLGETSVAAESDSRIKDLARLSGTTPEPLVGYGLVVGLNGTGDGSSSQMTINSLAGMLEKLDVTVDPALLKPKNVAAVIVTGKLDPNVMEGSKIDVTVESMNDASSLEGGRLVMTPMKAHDGTLCVLAQGAISIGGFNIKGGAGNSFRKNHSQAGIIPNGGIVKKGLGGNFVSNGTVSWLLNSPDFTTSSEVAKAINKSFGVGVAKALGSGNVEVAIPLEFREQPVMFVAQMGEIRARSDAPARVVLNERTGTIIIGKNVILKEAAVAHGNLKVVVNTTFGVSQPSSFSNRGSTVVTPNVQTDVDDREARVLRVPNTNTVADVVAVLNDIGASARDIIAILEALKQAGSLQADLILM
ncbi:MAG: flagellar basal body P-ring protein FlgI [Gemmatimonadales bacterium]|nr:flagellar basal body P-ring protein FlgI [Gemmatimonadales bacterium]